MSLTHEEEAKMIVKFGEWLTETGQAPIPEKLVPAKLQEWDELRNESRLKQSFGTQEQIFLEGLLERFRRRAR